MAELEAIVRAHLEGLDDDILEYVLSMIGEGGLDDEDMREQVGMFLISAEYCADEDAAAETLKALAAKLHAGGAAPPAQDSQVRLFTAFVFHMYVIDYMPCVLTHSFSLIAITIAAPVLVLCVSRAIVVPLCSGTCDGLWCIPRKSVARISCCSHSSVHKPNQPWPHGRHLTANRCSQQSRPHTLMTHN
jgi:hypothetical protein